MEAALLARAAAGSYVELDRALAGLRDTDRVAYRAFMGAFVLELVPADELAELGMVFVVSRMPDRVRVPASVKHAWVERHARRAAAEMVRDRRLNGSRRPEKDVRDAAVRAMWARTGSTVTVAAHFGLSVRRVQQLVYGVVGHLLSDDGDVNR